MPTQSILNATCRHFVGMKQAKQKIPVPKPQGVMPALVTPFDAAGEIDFPAFERHLTAPRAAGVTGWVPCGSSGHTTG